MLKLALGIDVNGQCEEVALTLPEDADHACLPCKGRDARGTAQEEAQEENAS